MDLKRCHSTDRAVESIVRMYEQSNRQAAHNLFGFYELHETLDDAAIELFLTLPVLKADGIPCCAYVEDSPYRDEVDGSNKCGRVLKDNLKICNAFQHFHFKASDPVTRNHDPELLKELTTFLLHAYCEEHEHKVGAAEGQAGRYLPLLKRWRSEHVFTESGCHVTEEAEREPQLSRLSRFFSRGTGSLKRRAANRRDQSTSPSPDDDSSPTVKPMPRQTLRSMASAPDLEHNRRASTYSVRTSADGWVESVEISERGGRKRDLLGFNSVVKLVAKM